MTPGHVPGRWPPLRLRPAPGAIRILPGLVVAGLFVLWAEHDGGYDNDTWYWGALLTLALLTATVLPARGRIRLSRAAWAALVVLSLYVAWSYLSMTWAAAPGVALQGSNRALLYLLLYALMLVLPWGRRSVLIALVAWAVGVGSLGIGLVVRLAANDDIRPLLVSGRLAAPTGYLNSTAALFTMGLLVSVALATQRRLPGPLRGLLLALACAELQLDLIVQSRGWLFTLPLVAVLVIVLATDRLRLVLFALVPVLGAAAILHKLLAVYHSSPSALGQTASVAGQAALLVCFGVLVAGTMLAWADWLARGRSLSPLRRRILGTTLSVVAVGAVAGGTVIATDGHPVRFIVHQWHGFSHQESYSAGASTHFLDVGSGRYDFWRVSLDAFAAHPIGGLGQDNFDDYYIVRGHTGEEPTWTHSLEMRLLAHTGLVGFLLFAAFLAAAGTAGLSARRRLDPQSRALAAIALLPVIVWLVHGSVDWFWEMPALSGPALGFLGMAGALGARPAAAPVVAVAERTRFRVGRPMARVAGGLMLIAATLTLGLPYLATRKASIASDLAGSDPAAALADLRQAAALDPLNPDVTRMAGTIALQSGRIRLAAERFAATLIRERGDWYAYLGSGLAASALGDRRTARRDFALALHIDRNQVANRVALSRVDTSHPLTPMQALNLLSAVH